MVVVSSRIGHNTVAGFQMMTGLIVGTFDQPLSFEIDKNSQSFSTLSILMACLSISIVR